MRVAHVSFHRDPQGRPARDLLAAWPTLTAHATAIQRAGCDIVVIQAAAEDETIVLDGVSFHFVGDRSRRLTRPSAVMAALRRADPTVVHAQGLIRPDALWWLRRAVSARCLVVQDHGGRPPHGWRAIFWRRVLEGVAVAFTSDAQGRAWQAAGALGPRQRLVAIPEASSNLAPGDQASARAATGLTGDPALLWLGRLDANKDPLTVLEAVARAVAIRPGITLTMAWVSGALEGAVRTRVADDPRLASRVRLLGRLAPTDVAQWLRAADMFVQGSHYEGSGYALIEAMACGTPAVVTDIPAFRTLLGDPPVGALVPVEDVGAFTAALLAEQPTRAVVRARFESHLSWDVLGRQWRACYESLGSR